MSDFDPELGRAHEDLCRFLSACWCEPTPAFAEERLFDSMEQAARRIDPSLAAHARRLGEACDGQDLQTLLVDYTRLLLGPVQPRATPYGSFWLSGETQLMQDSSLAVLELYRQGGFQVDEEARELPDHVALELEFLYLLTFSSNQARQADHLDALATTEALRRRFLAEHLGAWIGRFAAAVEAGAETAFYRQLATFTERFVRLQAA